MKKKKIELTEELLMKNELSQIRGGEVTPDRDRARIKNDDGSKTKIKMIWP